VGSTKERKLEELETLDTIGCRFRKRVRVDVAFMDGNVLVMKLNIKKS
jgi:hypothetical protein